MTFNNIKISEILTDPSDYYNDYFIVNDVQGRGVNENELDTIIAPGMDGVYTSNSRGLPRHLDVLITIKGTSFGHLRKKIDRLSEILSSEKDVPIAFDDEPNIIYYGRLSEVRPVTEKSKIYQTVLTFLCSDPYKYGPERTLSFPTDHVVIENNGTAEADPIFELTAKKKTTFAMISNADEEYNLIGEPADDDVQVVDSRTSILYENGSTINTWQTATSSMVDDHFVKKIDGAMGTDGAGIRADGYGTGDKLHGPAVYKEIGPIQDFEIETTFDIISRREIENFRMGINFLDENMNMLGHIGIKDNSRNYKRRTPLARYGPYRGAGRSQGNLIGDSQKNDQARETTLFYLRAKRTGNTFDFYIGEWQNHKHIRSWHEVYRDVNNDYNGRLKYITIYITKWDDRPNPSRLRINSVEVFELSQVTVDQTPYILYPGDVVLFDHKNDDILVNGEPRNDLKNFGGSFFSLKEGFNNLIVTPEDSFETNLRFRERFR